MKSISAWVLLLLLSQTALADPEVFNLVTENFPPFNMSLNGNEFEHDEEYIGGLSTEVVQELFHRAKYPYRMKLRNWNYAYNFVQRNPYRGVFGTELTEARQPMFKWVGPIANNDWVLFALEDSKIQLKTLEDAKAYRIGCYKDDSRAQFLKDSGFKAAELDDDGLNPKRLRDKEIDLWISSTVSGYYYARKAGITNIKPVFTIRSTNLYLAMNKDTPDAYIDKLNGILWEMKEEGVIEKIAAKYR
ncbi:amino acid ABC transporter substrate-binding protein [Hahella sp. CCB-MM4]|uniref:substrate-binding periplasmic protein n=1 Tax=Hahella sp. (strain CCB-MM4) TaxID=1926491 RepID=UPI000B9AFA0B|nr:transporter substrate-binding domain-containing protein [Hahella sp. CCB-MM4]OZG71603.1 amino acid ABC transporter substrate-binding protein [Hahella sp. CCB-MM4]